MLLTAVWGSGSNDVWAVGVPVTSVPFVIVHWDGAAWSGSPSPLGGFSGYRSNESVWGSGPNDVWVVGQHASVLHWDGSAWSKATGDFKIMNSDFPDLFGVWGSGPRDVWAVGDYNPGSILGPLLHY